MENQNQDPVHRKLRLEMMARWLPQLVEFVSGFDKRRGDLAGGVGFEVGTAGVDCDDRRVTRPSWRCVPTMPTSTPHTMRLLPSKLRVQLSPSFPRRSLSQWDVCCEPAGGDVGEPGGVGKLLLGALLRRPFPACSHFRRRRLSVQFRPVPVALTGAAFRIWVPSGAGRGCRGGHVR